MLAALLAPMLLGVTGAPDTVLLDFSTDWCPHCRAMEPAIHQLQATGYPVRTVNGDTERALTQQYHVTGFPTFVLVVDGREVKRVEGQTDIGELVGMFRAAGYNPSGGSAGAVAQNPGGAAGGTQEMVTTDGHEATFAQDSAATNAAPIAAATSPPSNADAPAAIAAPQTSFSLSDEQLLAACVRIKVADKTGNSYGSGTVIDVRSGEALVLTCAHLFRDSDGKGNIRVDLFGPNQQQVDGRLIGCDLEKDVGLVSMPAPAGLRAIPIAPPGYSLHTGDKVATIGCSDGNPPTVQSSHVDSIDRFRGPPNFQVAGQPVQGRSGGGVVSADGYVVGVCNAADPEDNEGLYAALPSIYKEIDRAKLSFVYNSRAASATLPTGGQPTADQSPPVQPAVALSDVERDPPTMPEKMPSAAPPNTTASSDAAKRDALPAGLTSDEAATLALIRQQARGAEVICIVRPADPHARSEIIVLDKASPAFLKKLADQRGDSLQPTSLQLPESAH